MYEIVATSAFRETTNSEEARRYVENKIEHPIRIISGLEEAKLIHFHPKAQSSSNKVFVDVGGGSTEIYIHKDGDHIIQSFQLGAVRSMLGKDDADEWKRLNKWLKKQSNVETLIGLGGSIKSFLNLNNLKLSLVYNSSKLLDDILLILFSQFGHLTLLLLFFLSFQIPNILITTIIVIYITGIE